MKSESEAIDPLVKHKKKKERKAQKYKSLSLKKLLICALYFVLYRKALK